jgi:hypothetical protein
MTCGQVLDLIPFYFEGYLKWSNELDAVLWGCTFLT